MPYKQSLLLFIVFFLWLFWPLWFRQDRQDKKLKSYFYLFILVDNYKFISRFFAQNNTIYLKYFVTL